METLLSSSFQFPHIPPQNNWNALIKHHAKLGNDGAILTAYTHMESLQILPDTSTLPLVLKACSRLNNVEVGKKIHSRLVGTELVNDVRVATSLVDLYCKSEFIEDARQVFDEMPNRDLVSWNAMLNGYVGVGEFEEAIGLFVSMIEEGFQPNSRTFVPLLSACTESMSCNLGKEIHGYCLRNGIFHTNEPHLGTSLIGFYMNFNPKLSQFVFDMMSVKNIVSWNAMITGYFESGEYMNAFDIFMQILREGIQLDSVTMLLAIQVCAKCDSLELARQIHQIAVKCKYADDLYMVSALVGMYSELRDLDSARVVFGSVHSRDTAVWNSMLKSFIEDGNSMEGLGLFLTMLDEEVKPDERTMVIVLSLCPDIVNGLRIGQNLHGYTIKTGMSLNNSLGNALLIMYESLNHSEAVKDLFGQMRDLDVISWNTLIAASEKPVAQEIFIKMQESAVKPNLYTTVSVLAFCKEETDLNFGREVHGYVIKRGIEISTPLNTALTEMYMNCGDESTARNLFDFCSTRDIVSWNSLISCYIRKNESHKALLLFRQMMSEIEPNFITLLNLLSSCTHLADLSLGKCLHAYITRRKSVSGSDISLLNSLLTMYARCGSLQSAEKMFDSLKKRDLVSWNALITGYGMHGQGDKAVSMFLRLLGDGFRPNSVTFIAVLSACSHAGLIDEGLEIFNLMYRVYDVPPELIHYGCIVDLLGRGGYLHEAFHFINSMPIEPDASLWRALLSATCQVRTNSIELVGPLFEKLVELEPMNEGNYILVSNIYAAAGQWPEVRRVRRLLREKGLQKPPGISWILVGDQVRFFTAGERSEGSEFNRMLGSLISSIKDTGYVPDLHWAYVDE